MNTNKYMAKKIIRRYLMRKLFVKAHNVKNFVELMNNLIDKSNEVPKMELVYGNPGLGKTRVAVWWVNRNDAIFKISIFKYFLMEFRL